MKALRLRWCQEYDVLGALGYHINAGGEVVKLLIVFFLSWVIDRD
jgi:hypothetical protein